MLKAVGNNIVLKAVPVEKQEDTITAAGVYVPGKYNEKTVGQVINLPNKDGKIRARLYVESIGGGVDTQKYNFCVGDEVIANDYDIQTQGDDEKNIWGICKAESIKVVIVE